MWRQLDRQREADAISTTDVPTALQVIKLNGPCSSAASTPQDATHSEPNAAAVPDLAGSGQHQAIG